MNFLKNKYKNWYWAKKEVFLLFVVIVLLSPILYESWVMRENSLQSLKKLTKGSDNVTDSNGISTYNGLGIIFKFNSMNPYTFQPVLATTIGNKIYIHPAYNQWSGAEKAILQSEYIQVFSKEDSFQQSIIKNTLLGYNPTNCPLNLYLPKPGFQEAVMQGVEGKCPKEFLGEYGRKYFLMEDSHPGKFVFFSREQNVAEAAQYKGGSWQDTLSFN